MLTIFAFVRKVVQMWLCWCQLRWNVGVCDLENDIGDLEHWPLVLFCECWRVCASRLFTLLNWSVTLTLQANGLFLMGRRIGIHLYNLLLVTSVQTSKYLWQKRFESLKSNSLVQTKLCSGQLNINQAHNRKQHHLWETGHFARSGCHGIFRFIYLFLLF